MKQTTQLGYLGPGPTVNKNSAQAIVNSCRTAESIGGASGRQMQCATGLPHLQGVGDLVCS